MPFDRSRLIGGALRLARALCLFVAVAGAVTAGGLGARKALVLALGESVYMFPELEMERMASVFSRKVATRAKLLILGDSTAIFSIAASHYPGAESLGLINSTSIEAYYTLKRVLESGAKPSCVLFSASFSWGANHGFFWPMFVSGNFYRSEDLDEIFEATHRNGDPPGRAGRLVFRGYEMLYRSGILDGIEAAQIQASLQNYRARVNHVEGFRRHVKAEKGSNPLTDHSAFLGKTDLTFDGGPAMNASEREYFARFADLLDGNHIRLFLLEVPFAASVPASFGREYWRKAEEVIASARPGNPIRYTRIAPAPLPAERYLSAGHLDLEGINSIEPDIRREVASCFGAKEAE